MLILETNKDALLKPLQTVTGIVERRHTLPILSNVLIDCQDGQVGLLGTDLEIQIHTDGPKSELEDFKLTVNAKKLQDILRALPDNATIKMEHEGTQLTVKAGKGRYNLQTLDARDFPTMDIAENISVVFTLTQEVLREMLSQVQYAMAVQDIRFYLNGLLMQVDGDMLRLVATDGHRLAYAQHKIEANLPKSELVLPRKTVLELFKLLAFPNEPITIEFLHNQVRFSARDTIIVSKIVEGKFPDYERVIPQDNNKIFRLSRTVFLDSLERASILASEKFKGTTLSVKPGLLVITCINNEQEKAQEEIEIAYQGEEVELSFNIQYLMDVLRNLHSEDVQLAFGAQMQSMLLTIPDNNDFKYIVMPMRI